MVGVGLGGTEILLIGVKKHCELNGNGPSASSAEHGTKRIVHLLNPDHKSLSCVGPKLLLERIDLLSKQKEIIMYIRNRKGFHYGIDKKKKALIFIIFILYC